MPNDASSSSDDTDGDDELESPSLARTARRALGAMLGEGGKEASSPGETTPPGDDPDANSPS